MFPFKLRVVRVAAVKHVYESLIPNLSEIEFSLASF